MKFNAHSFIYVGFGTAHPRRFQRGSTRANGTFYETHFTIITVKPNLYVISPIYGRELSVSKRRWFLLFDVGLQD